MVQKYMYSNKRWIALTCCLFLVLSLLFPNIGIYAATEDETTVRYSVLILDTSGSMDGIPAEKQEEAAIKFCESVLNLKGNNQVALVELNSSASVLTNFTNDIDVLKENINDLYISGGTNINEALEVSNDLLSDVKNNSNIIKNVVLCTDGLPESGTTSDDGPYTSSDNDYYYDYANAVFNTAKEMKNSYSLYSLGFFHSLEDEELVFARKFMNDIQNAGYYEVTDPNELQFKFGDIADDIINNGAKTFYYDNGYTAKCYYKDDYFKETSYEYNPSLATMSLCFAMSAFANGKEADYKNKSSNARTLLKSIVGVADDQIEVNDWYTKKPETDSIGVVIGNKTIEENNKKYTLIAIAVRGGGYEKEWASNFTIGRTGQHNGFDTAKNNVLKFLREYIEDKEISGPVKFWITGYSRAAATANLVGGEIDSGTYINPNINYELKDVYTYCFETPAGALTRFVKDNDLYNNIYSIINLNDPVPYVAPASLGFSRYGIDRYLPSKATEPDDYETQKEKMLTIYNSLDNTENYLVDDFQMKKLELKNWLPGGKKISIVQNDIKNNFSQGVFLSNYVTILSKDFLKNRDNYVDMYQDEIREICKVYFGNSGEQNKKLQDSLLSQARDNWGSLLIAYANPFVSEEDALKIVSGWLKTAINDAGITDYDEQTIEDAGVYICDLLLALISNHPNYFTTLVQNIKGIGAAHYPELCYSWLASMDENYNENATESFSTGKYRIIRINCAVDVNITDENGINVASIINEEPQDLGDKGLISGINENGEKYIVLPVDEAYDIQITGRENDTVNYGISEYNSEVCDYTRIINYFDINLRKGEVLNGDIPSYSQVEINSKNEEGSQVKYVLRDADDKVISDYVDLTGTDATNAYYSVNILSSDKNAGTLLGDGTYQYGNYALISATENENYSFVGWYENDKLISSEKEYRFCVKSDTNLVAKFKNTSSNSTPSSTSASAITANKPYSITTTNTAKTDIAKANIVLSKNIYTYTGKQLKPSIDVKLGNITLTNNVNYNITYKNNKNIGTASVIISGIGSYKGSITKKFKIVPKGTLLSKLASKKKGIIVKWKKQKKGINGYQIQYSLSKKFRKKTTKVETVTNNKTTTLTLSGLKKVKKYYVRIRTYKTIKKKKYFSSWSKTKAVNTK